MVGRPLAKTQLFPSDVEFIDELKKLGTSGFSKKHGMALRSVLLRRSRLEKRTGKPIQHATSHLAVHTGIWRQEEFPGRLHINIKDGTVIVAGDAHYWPTKPSLMHRALVHYVRHFAEEKSLRAVIMNGDVTDFPRLSQWPSVDWQKTPTVRDEVEVCTDRLHEIEMAARSVNRGVELMWTLGNHDARWSIYLARHAGEMEGVTGITLKDHFPRWAACWSLMINPETGPGTTFIKHRGPSVSGRTAPLLNVEKSGCSIVTNHLHNARVHPYNDLRPYPLYGVDTGCIADVYGPQFLYLEDNPRNWRSAFAILTYKDGRLLYPELVLGWDEKRVQFRGGFVKP